jgi:DNA-binding CsgD family transcriptional regulator
MDFPQRDLPAKAPHSLTVPRHLSSSPSRAPAASREPFPFTLILLAELSACVHLITSDIAHTRNLEAARAGWIERLRAIIAMIEGASTRPERQRRMARRGDELQAAPVVLPISDAVGDTVDITIDDAGDEDRDAATFPQTGAPPKHSGRSTVSTASTMLAVPERPRLPGRSTRSVLSEPTGLREQSDRAPASIIAIQAKIVPAQATPLRALRLTAREREIMKLARRGVPPRAIARRLQLSVQTVYTHLRNIRRKQR